MPTYRRRSFKREAIYGELSRSKDHPSAETLYQRLKPEYPELSLGTVYRNLTLFREEGRVECVATVNGEERFDADTAQHAHFICRRCGRVIDMGVPPERELLSVAAPGQIEKFSLTYYGVCDECRA